jgi:hypothetical protein
VRRAQAIDKHLSAMICEPLELQRLFDLWLRPSEDLGQYLWGHRNEPIQVARQMINILPSASIVGCFGISSKTIGAAVRAGRICWYIGTTSSSSLKSSPRMTS